MSASSKMALADLLSGFTTSALPAELEICGLAADSRKVKPGYLFLACEGAVQNGLAFVEDAIQQGAAAIAIDAEVEYDSEQVCVVPVEGLSQRVGLIATKFYGYPSSKINLVGITGTNGKTSCSHLMAQCFELNDVRCGVVGTMGFGFSNHLESLANTTPGPVELQFLLNDLYQKGASCIAMEVSSHGLEQHRTSGCDFSVAVFTNLSRDHLDYHGSMEAYGQAKLKLFTDESLNVAVVNLDDNFAADVVAAVPNNVETIGVSLSEERNIATNKFVSAKVLSKSLSGTTVLVSSDWGRAEFTTQLLGEFNISNILLVIAVALHSGVAFDELVKHLPELRAPKGRLESFYEVDKPLVVVDYAHTPDALQKVLQTLHAHTVGNLWVLFGCGGDRDSGKRPLMGEVAELNANYVWLTDDNPRTEPSQQIIDDILSGIQDKDKVKVVTSRETAIRELVSSAAANDIILIAGKGHEDYQIIGDQILSYSDRETVARVLQEVA